MYRPRANRVWPWIAVPLVVCGGCSPMAFPPAQKPAAGPAVSAAAPVAPASKPTTAASSARLFDGKTLAGWKTADEVEFTRHGKVEVHDGAIQLAAGDPATGVVRTDTPPTDSYELTLSAKRTEGQDFFCGLTFPVGKESCSLIVGGWGGQVVGLSNVDGAAADENQTTVH
ncbi:MAG: DUF1080 domain-containing protein, partial [Planctomycetia bacterium]|nr:DUF1080 domain-containing protein [Planctomycetia bacterium]